jgi:hypothetical protein
MNDNRNNLGPLTPHTKPRKSAKNVLAGLVAAAGIAGGTAVFVAGGSADAQVVPRMAGMPPAKKLATTQPTTAKVIAMEAGIAGGMPARVIKPTTEPTTEPTTNPATTTTQPEKPEIKAKRTRTDGIPAAEFLIIKEAPTTQPDR